MELSGQRRIAAPRPVVWDALNDPRILLRSIPGCEDVEKASETETLVRVAVRLGPVRARFVGKMSMSDVVPAERCTLSFDGAGGAAGFAKGVSNVTLRDVEGGTLLDYSANASVGGKLGQIGSRLIDASAKKIADEFFVNLERELTAPPASSGDADGVSTASTVPADTADLAGNAAASPVPPAPAPSDTTGRFPGYPAAASRPASAWSGGWRAELYRVGWFALGVAVTLFLTHWSR